MQKIGFGGGCPWCTEAVFSALKGVANVEQGWIDSTHPDAKTLSEAVIVHFESLKIPLHVLIEIHLYTHNATSNHSMRQKYRSAIYTFDKTQKLEAEAVMIEKQKFFDKTLVTKIYPFKSFKLNSEKFLNYYAKNRDKPFCSRYIEPKLALLLREYADYVMTNASKQSLA